jgi:ATP-dependent RNA helicase DeaD
MDHIKKGHLAANNVRISCLDEADEMLSMGFVEDVRAILRKFPKDAQTLLFSATVSKETEALVTEFLNEPEQIYLSSDLDNVETIRHVLYEAPHDLHKAKALLYLLDIERPDNAIIFCNTRADASTVASFLDRQGLDAHLLSGELAQSQRSRVMNRIKSGKVKFLVATDVASRGIDISNLTHVINYMLPNDPKTYLHRIGRTGRLGKMGTAISLVSGSDLGSKKMLKTQHAIAFNEEPFPDSATCIKNRVEQQAQQIQRALGTMVFESYLPTVDGLLELENGKALLAAALRAFFQWDRQRRADVTDVETPQADKRSSRDDRKGQRDDRKGGRDGDRNQRGAKGRKSNSGDGNRSNNRNSDKRKKNDGRKKTDNRKKTSKPNTRNESAPKAKKEQFDDLDSLLSFD